jgi:hypothetical protein
LVPSSLQDSWCWCSPAWKPAREPVGRLWSGRNPWSSDHSGGDAWAPFAFLEAPLRTCPPPLSRPG